VYKKIIKTLLTVTLALSFVTLGFSSISANEYTPPIGTQSMPIENDETICEKRVIKSWNFGYFLSPKIKLEVNHERWSNHISELLLTSYVNPPSCSSINLSIKK
jgi:hypothetical protein